VHRRPGKIPKSCTRKEEENVNIESPGGKKEESNAHLPNQIQTAHNKLGQPTPLTSTCRNRGISAFALSPLSALSMAISERTVCSVFMVVTAAAASAQVEVHRLFGRRREVRVMRRGVECAAIPVHSELAVMKPKWLS